MHARCLQSRRGACGARALVVRQGAFDGLTVAAGAVYPRPLPPPASRHPPSSCRAMAQRTTAAMAPAAAPRASPWPPGQSPATSRRIWCWWRRMQRTCRP